MKALVIGGTRFLGWWLVRELQDRGWDVSNFHRGSTPSTGLDGVEELLGDRETNLGPLGAGDWDAVFDTCGYVPRVVSFSAKALAGRTSAYVFISSVSVYEPSEVETVSEDSPVGVLSDPSTEEITGETYGPLKAACEDVVRAEFGHRAYIVRPGLIVGPRDPTDRFTYWPIRMRAGGPVIVPDRRLQHVQWVDVRDLAAFAGSLPGRGGGTWNVVGPEEACSLDSFVRDVCLATGAKSEVLWTSTDWLEARDVKPWTDLPLVLPFDGSLDAIGRASNARGIQDGLRFRSVADTVRDLLAWWDSEPREALKAGISDERHAELVAKLTTPGS